MRECLCVAQVRKEKENAVRACESAYEAGELLKEQLALLKMEKETAEGQVGLTRSEWVGLARSVWVWSGGPSQNCVGVVRWV